jgi:hypothetical protein
MRELKFESGTGRFKLYGIVILCGNDICICICGGDKHHIGAVALASPRKSLKSNNISSSTSVLCSLGHKEDDLVRTLSLDISRMFNCQSSVSAGIHIENASIEEINMLYENFLELCRDIIIGLKKEFQHNT